MDNQTPARILLIDDHEATRETLSEELADSGHEVVQAECFAAALKQLKAGEYDLILSDLVLPDGTGLDLIAQARSFQPDAPFVLITGHATIQNAIEATRLGAYDYIRKPEDLNKLRLVVKNALDLRSLRRTLAERSSLDAIIGKSPAIMRLKDIIAQVARTEATVLIQGESGTGKELVANALQRLSDRAQKPFIKVNVAALPKDLLESELFGHEKGAFTGAVKARQGRFELAHGGTLFLDEIGELPVETQVKLLRVLQEQEFERVGGSETIKSDFRLVCATNADLKALIAKGQFREDLYFRINVVPARIPPLRERPEDLPILCEHFLRIFNAKYNAKRELGRAARDVMARYSWPGNVRELENAIERAVVIGSGASILPLDLPEEISGGAPPISKGDAYPAGLPLAEVEKRYIISALEAAGGNKTHAAKSLRIGLKTLYRKLEEWGMAAGAKE